jgi:hypothetical protein
MVKIHVNPVLGLKKQAYVVFSFPIKGLNHVFLEHLQSGHVVSPVDKNGAELSILVFSLFKYLEFKLGGSPLEAMRTKLCEAHLSYQDGEVIMRVVAEPSFTAVRKVLSVVEKNLSPEKLGPIYKKYSAQVGKHSDALMHGAMNEVQKALAQLSIYITGAIKVPEGKDLDFSVEKFKVLAGAESPSEFKQADEKMIKVADGPAMVLLAQDLLHTVSVESEIHGSNLLVMTKMPKIDGDRIDRFVDQKVVKLGEKLRDVLLLVAAQMGKFSAPELEKLAKQPLGAAAIKAALKKTF